MTVPSFRQWIEGDQSRRADLENLKRYLRGLGESWQSEFKSAGGDENQKILRAVSAIANSRGGEVFVGVSDDGEIQGVMMAPNELTDLLRQPKAERGSWFCVDLNETIVRSTPVGIEGRTAFVAEVANIGIPAFVMESGKLELYVRNGDQSRKQGSFEGLHWSRSATRFRVLRTILREAESAIDQLDYRAPQQSIVGGLSLPFLSRCMEDGTFYTVLSRRDRQELLGYNPQTGSHADGALSPIYQLRFELEAVFRREHNESDVWDWGEHLGGHSLQKLVDGVVRLREYLKEEHIDVTRD